MPVSLRPLLPQFGSNEELRLYELCVCVCAGDTSPTAGHTHKKKNEKGEKKNSKERCVVKIQFEMSL